MNFRGNVRFDERHHPAGKKTMKCFNSQMPCQLTFLITEADKHLQRNYDFFKVRQTCIDSVMRSLNLPSPSPRSIDGCVVYCRPQSCLTSAKVAILLGRLHTYHRNNKDEGSFTSTHSVTSEIHQHCYNHDEMRIYIYLNQY